MKCKFVLYLSLCHVAKLCTLVKILIIILCMLLVENYKNRLASVRTKTTWIKPSCLNEEALLLVVEIDVEIIIHVWFGACVGKFGLILGVLYSDNRWCWFQ